jgi:hypothetical protein
MVLTGVDNSVGLFAIGLLAGVALILTDPMLALPRWAYRGLSGATTLVGEVFHFHVAGARSHVDAIAGVVALAFWRDVAQSMQAPQLAGVHACLRNVLVG